MNLSVYNSIVSFIWNIADDVLRDVYVRGKYKDVILPMTVIRRLDCLLEPTKKEVLEQNRIFDDNKINNKSGLTKTAKCGFYNISQFTLKRLLDDPSNVKANFENYLDGFSDNVQEIISKFKLRNQIETLHEGNILFKLIDKYTSNRINLSPNPILDSNNEVVQEALTNIGMGYVFEELIRKFNEENNEEAGEHFTPRDIISLMSHIVFLPVKDKIVNQATYLIYDPASGSGGMLTEAEKFVLDNDGKIKSKATWHLYAQEVNPETYAICTADMLIKGEHNFKTAFGSTLSKDGFPNLEFDFMLSNPPYGKTWKVDQDSIFDGKKKEIIDSRFKVGLPRINDGQLLFTVNMLSKMKHNSELGSRIATIHNGSALFTGDAGSGESEIRKWIIENDWLDCIIALPTNMFYNTGISTYIWIMTNKKDEKRKGKVQLINAVDIFEKMRKSLGSKSNTFTKEQIELIANIYLEFEANEVSKIFDNSDFGYNKITVERPLRLTAEISDDRIRTFNSNPSASNLNNITEILKTRFGSLPQKDFNVFKTEFEKELKKKDIKLSAKDFKLIFDTFTYKDENAEKVIKKKTKDSTEYEVDSELRDYESIPLKEDIEEYFQREVLPYVSDAWIDYSKTISGYEVSFNKYFYKYQALRSISDIKADILDLEQKTEGLINEILDF